MNGVLQHRWRAVWFLVLSASAAGAGGGIAPGRLPGSATAGAALDRCSQADHARGPARADLLKKGLALAEEAVAADDGDARAHFARLLQPREAGARRRPEHLQPRQAPAAAAGGGPHARA